jgi:hypothetical protein
LGACNKLEKLLDQNKLLSKKQDALVHTLATLPILPISHLSHEKVEIHIHQSALAQDSVYLRKRMDYLTKEQPHALHILLDSMMFAVGLDTHTLKNIHAGKVSEY